MTRHAVTLSEEAAERESTEARLSGLVAAIAQGDEGALARLYDTTSAWVYGMARRILEDEGAADEVTLDVYMQVWRKARTFSGERGRPSAWLLTLARSRAIDRLRTLRSRARREDSIEEGFDLAAPGPGPDGRSMIAERTLRIRAGVGSLPVDQRRAIELAFFGGLTHVEIADRLGEPLGTIKTRIRLGMTKLRDLLKPLEDWE